MEAPLWTLSCKIEINVLFPQKPTFSVYRYTYMRVELWGNHNGIKLRCYWERLREHLANTLVGSLKGTWLEHVGNTLGTRKKNQMDGAQIGFSFLSLCHPRFTFFLCPFSALISVFFCNFIFSLPPTQFLFFFWLLKLFPPTHLLPPIVPLQPTRLYI